MKNEAAFSKGYKLILIRDDYRDERNWIIKLALFFCRNQNHGNVLDCF